MSASVNTLGPVHADLSSRCPGAGNRAGPRLISRPAARPPSQREQALASWSAKAWAGILLLLVAAGPAWAADTLRVALGQKQAWGSSFFIPVIAVEQGFFAREGIEIETIFTRGGAETVQAALSGSVDIGAATGVLGVISAFGRGAPLRILAADATGADDLYWYVEASSPRRDARDLRGATVGYTRAGSSTHLLALDLQRQFAPDAKLVPCGGIPDCYTMVKTGQLEVGIAGIPFFLDEVRAGQLRVVARGSDLPRFSGQTTRVFFARAEFLDRHVDLMQRFFRAYQQAVNWSYDNLDQALSRYAQHNGMSLESARLIPDFSPKEAHRLAPLGKLELTLQQALDSNFLDSPLSPEQLEVLLQIQLPPDAPRP